MGLEIFECQDPNPKCQAQGMSKEWPESPQYSGKKGKEKEKEEEKREKRRREKSLKSR